jgi:phosphatidylethanolamine N-methyltransferase
MDWTVGGTLLRHVLGLVSLPSTSTDKADMMKALISLHVWAAVSSYEVLGDSGKYPTPYRERSLMIRMAIL